MKMRRECLRYLELMGEDIKDYRRLRGLLDEQFHAALRHQAERVAQVCEDIAGLTDVLNGRRSERTVLAQAITREAAPERSHKAVGLHMTAASAQLLSDWTEELEQMVRECKQLNLRNCSLLTEQHEIMQRVLNQEQGIYAPV
jgi:flagellar biosynthesis protein FlgN